MIQLKNADQIAKLRDAGRITGEALLLAGESVKPGVSTKELDDVIRRYIRKCGAEPSFLGYGGFPASACISINEQVIHGIPKPDVYLKDGDIVTIAVGAFYHGFHGDSARTFACGNVSDLAKKLINATEDSFRCALEKVAPGARLGDVGSSVEARAKQDGFFVVKKYIGHGVGHELHEDPEVPNYGTPGRGLRLSTGMVIAIEPMVCVGTGEVRELDDGWTVVTADNGLSAHYEHMVAITENGVELLTEVK